ncbi:MAG: hypothetical protein ACREEA_03115, partial [Stellaceae bacterium]
MPHKLPHNGQNASRRRWRKRPWHPISVSGNEAGPRRSRDMTDLARAETLFFSGTGMDRARVDRIVRD